MSKELRDYQLTGSFEVRKNLGLHRRVLYVLPTGGGKTAIASDVIKLAANKKIKTVFLVDRELLLKQAIKDFRDNGIKCESIESDLKYLWITECYVAMVETFYRRYSSGWFDGIDLGLIVIDEAHMGNFDKIVELFPNQFILGLTATPVKSGGKPLNKIYNKIIIGETVPNLQKQGYLVPAIEFGHDQLIECAKQAGEFTSLSQIQQFSQNKIDSRMMSLWQEKSYDKKTIVFNINVEHNKAVNEEFKKQGIATAAIDAKTPNRENIEEDFKAGKIQVLNNVGIHTKGSNFPDVECIVVNHLTNSLAKWFQEVGRGARPCNEIDKKNFHVIDTGNNLIRHPSYNEEVDWLSVFDDESKDKKHKVKNIKICPVCSAYIFNVYKPTCDVCKTPIVIKNLLTLQSQMPAEIANKDINSMTFKELQIYGKFKGYSPQWAFMYKYKRK